MQMTDLDLIKDVEQHVGFVINRLTCDGNIYADKIHLENAYGAKAALGVAFKLLRESLKRADDSEKTFEAVRDNMDSFDTDDWND